VDNFQSFLDATPVKGVIIVEYFWQPPPSERSTKKRPARDAGSNTSLVFFKRILASDECWCGSKRRFARCHRRDDDWTYVTLDPDQGAYSPVVLLERTFGLADSTRVRKILEAEPGLLPVEHSDSLAAWGVPITPPLVNEVGPLILGTIGVSQNEVHLETNSEKRFGHLSARFESLFGDSVGNGATLRAEPQKAFPLSSPKKRKKRSGR
jgi:hypothetical protein